MLLDLLALLGLGFGALIGLGSLISPSWAAGVVRLIADPDRPGGYSEFRATFGGLLFLSHSVAFALVLIYGGILGGLFALPFAAGWFGAAFGRGLSLLLDREKLGGAGMNPIWIAVELAMGLAIGAPMLHLP